MMKKVAFTICSNNYLAQAKVLSDSILKHNPDYEFIIGLCDKKNQQIDYSVFSECTLIEVEELAIPNFHNMCIEYDIIELNTSIKPFLFSYIFKSINADLVFYIDPDICVFDSLSTIEAELIDNDILLTPHIYTAIPEDGCIPQENIFLNYGLYNLGFLGLKKSNNSEQLLNWWSTKLASQCLNRVSEGHFVDQLPMNYAPIFFDKVKISDNWGVNVAYWNFHERQITLSNGCYFINGNIPLVLFHFSNYKVSKKDEITPFFNRFTMDAFPAIKTLYANYYRQMIDNKFNDYTQIDCFYIQLRAAHLQQLTLNKTNNINFKIKVLKAIKRRLPRRVMNFITEFSNL